MKITRTEFPSWCRLVRDPVSLYEVGALNKYDGEFSGPQPVFDFLKERAQAEEQEVFYVLCLNRKNKLIACQEATRGTLDAVLIDPKIVFRLAIAFNAASVIVVHNHPSGDPNPSQADISMTKQLVKAGQLLGCDVLDSIIIGQQDKFFSCKEHGLL